MIRAFGLVVGLLALLAVCSQGSDQPPPAPALWEVTGPGGAHGYLFGTAHSLPRGYRWRTETFDKAFAASDALAVEVADLDDPAAVSAAFSRLATTPRQGPLAARVAPEHRALVARLMEENGLGDADFANMETWAAALTLAQAGQSGESANGADVTLLRDAGGKRIVELEGLEPQLALFDTLPQAEQADLLEGVAAELAADDGEAKERLHAWLTGDLDTLARETPGGILADPELRAILLVGRNRDWADRIAAELGQGGTVFVAVGAAHMLGPEGLPALLEARGFMVTRIQ